MRFLLGHAQRVVIKLGTNLLTAGGGRLDVGRVSGICTQIQAMRAKGLQVVVVSSGAVGLGMGKLGLLRRPTDLASLQACAAIGQSLLMETWQHCFQQHGIIVAQILLTREDVRHRERHLAITHTLEHLLKLGVVPIVNENDTVSAAEIKFGDNDILSALTASLVQADLLVILSTIPGLMDLQGDGRVVPVVTTIDAHIEAMAGGTTSATAVGGMRSKIEAAKVATRSGCGVFIGSGERPELLAKLLEGRAEGTFFVPAKLKLEARKRWIAFFDRPHGAVRIDNGAVTALREQGKSLLAKGVLAVVGHFAANDMINVEDIEGKLLARGLSQFNSEDLLRVAGLGSTEIKALFPERKRLEIIHRDSLVLMAELA